MVKVMIGVALVTEVLLLKTEYSSLVTIDVQFVGLKCTVVMEGQFQKARPPMVSTPVPKVSVEILLQ